MIMSVVFLTMLYTDWFYLFNTAFFWPKNCPWPQGFVLVFVLKDLASSLASRIFPSLKSGYSDFFLFVVLK